MATRSERTVGGIIDARTNEAIQPDTLIISNPVHADFKPWLNKKRQIVHVMFNRGSISGNLVTYRRGEMTVRLYGESGKYAYVLFKAEDVSEIDITGEFAPTIYVRFR